MSTQDDTGALVQLGHYEIAVSVLEQPGDDLDAFTNNVLLHPAFVADPALSVPMHRWRVVFESAATDGIKAQQILAAPHPTRSDAWVMAFRISSEDGFATFRFDPEPLVPVSPKKERRAQLRLIWPDGHNEDTSLSNLRIRLVNNSSDDWGPSERDDFYVAGVINAHIDGNPVPGGGYYAYIAGTPSGRALKPGEEIELGVDIDQELFARLTPGKYVVTAVLISLDLTSAATTATKY